LRQDDLKDASQRQKEETESWCRKKMWLLGAWGRSEGDKKYPSLRKKASTTKSQRIKNRGSKTDASRRHLSGLRLKTGKKLPPKVNARSVAFEGSVTETEKTVKQSRKINTHAARKKKASPAVHQ